MAEPRPSVCPTCGASFSCGVDTGRCWCAAVPVDADALRGKADAEDGCLCPTCLRELSVPLGGEVSTG